MTDPFIQMLNEDDPIPRLHALRDTDPVHFVEPLGLWLITRHADIRQLFNDPDNVTHDRRAWEHYDPSPEGTMRRWSEDHGIFAVNPQGHARLRALVAAAFTPRAVRRMERQIREVIDRTAVPLAGREGTMVDLLGEFTNKAPNAVSRIWVFPSCLSTYRFWLAQRLEVPAS